MSLFTSFVLYAGLVLLLTQRTRTLLTYFQQEEYDNRRFLRSWLGVRLFDVRGSLATVIARVLAAVGLPWGGAGILLALAFGAIAYVERRYRYKKPLALTERARRLLRLTLAQLVVLALTVFWHPAMALVALQLVPLAMILANLLLQPVQTRINLGFEQQARARLERLNPVRIGITGSFGKTTVKHMLAEILEASGPVFFSPGSINTVLGHTRHIRQRLQWAHRYFVAEMGAYGIGSIKRLCDFVHPQYGIVTAVGDAHTERFGSLDAIAQAKSELVAEVCARGGVVVINADLLRYRPFQGLRDRYGAQVITVGPVDAEAKVHADVVIDSHELEGGSWSISLRSEDERVPPIRYELPLLGAHNVLNSALAVTMALIIDRGMAGQIPYFTRTIAQVPHRLQKVGAPGSALILDDAYNANEQGFISAVSAMSDLAGQRGGRRILVTPGIAELGLEHDRVHARLGAFCAAHCDLVYAVNPDRIDSFVTAAKAGRAEVIAVPNFATAKAAIAKAATPADVILYENDLPDLLEETRLL